MKKKISILSICILSLSLFGCTAKQNATMQKKAQPIGGIESSAYGTENVQRIKIANDNTSIRKSCSNEAPIVQKTNKGNSYDVVSKVQDWYAVKLPDNSIGFIPTEQGKAVVVDDKKPQSTPDNTATAPQGSTTGGAAQGTNIPKTPSAQTNSSTLSSSEQQMIKMVNDARAQNNLPALKVDTQLCNVARIKAQDMIDNNYFSHSSPKYGSPFDMMKSFGIKYVSAGENIAGNQSVQNAQNALMNSPGHRKNILNPDFTHIGIGIRQGGPYGNMFSQMFISRPQ
ncbi:CAP domain-containing protein [Clostridium drakei]|uniref:Serine protease n=1 Tax=Clostridium drakei TaxID=332101 RepID=A0A2U8DSF8_9CLOT|nr:CAP domain-containing protein [Clostridium drakei]AWI05365.1 serine protease [Clostridium drakei]